MTNIYAHTALGCNYPSFLSVNVDDKGEVEFTVRSAIKADGRCGDTAQAKLTPEQLRDLARQLYSYACTGSA